MRKTSFLRPLTKKIFCAALGCLFLIGVADAMQIFVDCWYETITLEVEPNDSIDAIKAKVQEKKGISPDQQALFHNSVWLEEGKTLSDYGITQNAILYSNRRNGPWTGGNTVTILGTELCTGSDVTTVTLCGIEATVVSATPTQVVVTAGSGPTVGTSGNVVVVSETLGETVYPNAYTYNPAGQIGYAIGKIASGGSHSLGLKVDGSIVSWGK